MKKTMILGLFLLHYCVYGQINRAAHWYFGYEAGIDFSSGVAVADNTGKLNSIEGCSSISDRLGNLLFYSNGENVWNRNHTAMMNSAGIIGNPSSAQSSIIVPQPGNDSHYFLFSTLGSLNNSGLYYHIVDMNLGGGLGGITSSKNIQLYDKGTEEIAATYHCNAKDYWIVARQRAADTLKFYSFLLNENGLGSPVISTFYVRNPVDNKVGGLTFSQDGSTLCFSSFGTPVYLFDFNIQTGQLYLNTSIPVKTNETVYSNAFSPDGSKVYITSWQGNGYSMLSQFDLSQPNIPATRVNLDSVDYSNGSPNGYGFIGQIRLAPDQKMYVSRWNQELPFGVHPGTYYSLDSIDVIHQPNRVGNLCNFQRNYLYLDHKPTQIGLPNFVSNFTSLSPPNATVFPSYNRLNDTVLCEGMQVILAPQIPNSTYLWQDNSADSTFTVSQAGTYWVEIETPCGLILDTVKIEYRELPSIDLGNDTILCQGESRSLNVSISDAIYRWQDNSTDSVFTVTQAGTYWVEANTLCGTANDSINIEYDLPLVFDLGNDTSLCPGEILSLDASISAPNTNYQWQDNSESPIFEVIEAGTYWVKVSSNNVCGPISDSLTVSYHPVSIVDLGQDTSVCLGESFILDVSNLNAEYLWQDNSTESTFTVTQPGKYSVVVSTVCEAVFDEILVAELETCNCKLFIPNAFTPNYDGANEVFLPVSHCPMTFYEFKIFNRWGNKVFQTSNQANPWDGTFRGNILQEGVYVYQVRYRFEDEPIKQQSGSITLIR